MLSLFLVKYKSLNMSAFIGCDFQVLQVFSMDMGQSDC